MVGAGWQNGGCTGWQKEARFLLLGFAILAGLLLPVAVHAASSTVRVSAIIQPWLKFSAIPQVGSYQVDAAALRRGYVDLPSSLAVELATNVRHEVVLDLVSAGPETIHVLDGGTPSFGTLRFTAVANNAPVARQFGLRVLLPPGIGEGTYPISLQVSAARL